MGIRTIILVILLCVGGTLPIAASAANTQQLAGQFFALEFDTGSTLYSQPGIGGNAVKFLPTEFFAAVVGEGPAAGRISDLTEDSFSFTLTAREGYAFTNFVWTALGDYSRLLFGSDPTDTEVGLLGQMTITDVVNPAAVPLLATMLVSDVSLLGNNKAWNASASIGNQGQAAFNSLTKVTVTLHQQLSADVEGLGRQAKIQMKLGKLLVGVEALPAIQADVVPLPPSALLFGTAMVAVAGLSRRFKRT